MNSDISKIKTIILCGGTGTRLKEETEFKPKPLVQIGEKPIVWHIMKIYAHFGFNNFILALGYKGDQIKDYFLKSKYYNADFLFNTKEGQVTKFLKNSSDENEFNITFADTGLETPHGERILKLKPYIEEDIFMVTYGDGVSNIDIKKLIDFHRSHGKIATISGVHPISRWGLINSDENHLVSEFSQKPLLFDYVNGGFMVFNKEFFDYIKPGEMIEDSWAKLIPMKQVALYKHEGFWYGMDTYKDFLILNELWEKDPQWKVWGTPKEIIMPVLQKTTLVTGGAGFIGSNLVNELIRQGQRVVVIDDLSSGKKENISSEAIFYQSDIRNKKVIEEIFEKEQPSIVYHFAARPLVEDAYHNPFEVIDTNIMGTVNILESCRKQNNIESIIVVSSDKAYGKSQQLPYNESTPLKGDHPYDVSKSSADLIAQTYAKTYNLPIHITRFSNVFGPQDTNFSRIIPGIIESIIKNMELQIRSDGTMIREYTYIKDIVLACIKLANHKRDFGEESTFGSKNIMSVLDVIRKTEETLGVKVNYKILNNTKNEIPTQYLDWTKAKEKLQWEPSVNFEEGIRETFNWHKNNFFKN